MSRNQQRPAAAPRRPSPALPLGLAVLLAALAGGWIAFPASAQSGGATLSIGSGSGAPGATGIGVAASIDSDPGTQVSAIQFDVAFDAGRLSIAGVTIGGAASSAGKSLSWSQPSSGVVRIVIQGGNSAIPDGTIATISFNVSGSAAPGASALTPGNAVASDPGADPVSLTLNGGTFSVTAPPATSTAIASATTAPSSTSTATRTPTRTPTGTASRTATSAPSATRTPSSTPTRTLTSTAGPSPTPSRTFTPGPTSTPVTPSAATATRTPSRTPTRTATQSALTQSATPGLSSTPTGPPPSATTTSPAASASQSGTATYPPEIETAAAATGTALAEIELAVAATATALAVAAGPPASNPPTSPSPAAVVLIAAVVLAMLVAGAIALWRGLSAGRPRS